MLGDAYAPPRLGRFGKGRNHYRRAAGTIGRNSAIARTPSSLPLHLFLTNKTKIMLHFFLLTAMATLMDSAAILTNQIAAKKSELAQANRRVEVLRAELATLEKVARLLGASSDSQAVTLSRGPSNDGYSTKRRRSLSATWKAVLAAMAQEPERAFSYDALLQLAADGGYPTTNPTLRSQMSIYQKRGLVERVSSGEYRITRRGLDELGDQTPTTGAEENDKLL